MEKVDGKTTSTGLKELNSKIDHDASEDKMLEEDTKFVTKNEAELKFISDEKKNGDAKVDIGNLKAGFVGMGKEELMRYANDPFWIRLRWILFILFWLVWLLMLAGAIGIIIAAPKCTAPQPRKWWEEGPLIDLNFFYNSENNDTSVLQNIGAKNLILSGLEETYSLDNDKDSYVQDIIKAGYKVILELTPGSTEQWFNASVYRQEPYTNYYIWATSIPKHWVSPIRNSSSWVFSDERNEYYLKQYEKPDLNFRNKDVVEEFNKIIRHWLNLGVSGFRLSRVDRLLVDPELRDESIGGVNSKASFDEPGYYTHKYTRNQEDLGEVLYPWRQIVHNLTNSEGVLMLTEDTENLQPYTYNDTILTIDLPSYAPIFNLENRTYSASKLARGIQDSWAVLGSDNWPAWKYKAGTLSEDVLQILTFLLPGTPVISTDIDKLKNSVILNDLIKLRTSQTVLFGNYTTYLLQNDTIFAYTREKSGQPGYLVLCNPTSEIVTVDVTSIPSMSEDLTVSIVSQNFTTVKPKSKVLATAITVPSKSAAVFTYVHAEN
ncbi:neutral and basic amino acid transport protein rBAT isoform X2 [Chrysoperla carnea]|uniref:neutral and basic amino acid transport protein rBAT isoform X2 n=1 Tax=Chrysoperla carnea TaxID=189513 RepID=UPI001D06C058|nr:neutral and basic amino acid transport protein rBAT isoform X2 [Chrysoperla carnea]